jgi:hypothetical protein
VMPWSGSFGWGFGMRQCGVGMGGGEGGMRWAGSEDLLGGGVLHVTLGGGSDGVERGK